MCSAMQRVQAMSRRYGLSSVHRFHLWRKLGPRLRRGVVMKKLIPILILSGCFGEPPPIDSVVAPDESSSSGEGSGASSSGDSSSSEDSAQGATSGGTSEGSSSSSSGTWEEQSTGDPCELVEVPVPPLAYGEMTTVSIDFNAIPGAPGEVAEVCVQFTTDNAASGRTITIEEQVLAFGPCGSEPAEMYTLCAEYTKPKGTVDVIVDNNAIQGCQTGLMGDLVLSFECGEG